MERKRVPRSVTGAVTCTAAGNVTILALSEAATPPCSPSVGTMDGNGGEPRQRVTRVAKPHKLRAAPSGRCEEPLRW
jgi:hypothetical protein